MQKLVKEKLLDLGVAEFYQLDYGMQVKTSGGPLGIIVFGSLTGVGISFGDSRRFGKINGLWQPQDLEITGTQVVADVRVPDHLDHFFDTQRGYRAAFFPEETYKNRQFFSPRHHSLALRCMHKSTRGRYQEFVKYVRTRV